jgi:hypothetical protein
MSFNGLVALCLSLVFVLCFLFDNLRKSESKGECAWIRLALIRWYLLINCFTWDLFYYFPHGIHFSFPWVVELLFIPWTSSFSPWHVYFPSLKPTGCMLVKSWSARPWLLFYFRGLEFCICRGIHGDTYRKVKCLGLSTACNMCLRLQQLYIYVPTTLCQSNGIVCPFNARFSIGYGNVHFFYCW